MLTISDMTKSFGERVLFENVALQVNRNERVGIVGPNGSGKTTLFSLILGRDTPDGGEITIELSDDELLLQVAACPAVTYLRQAQLRVSPLYYETTRTVNETICEGTPFAAELLAYDAASGRSRVRFARRQA